VESNYNQISLNKDKAARALVKLLEDNQEELHLADSYLYHNFPLFRDEEDAASRANILVLSKKYGALLFECSDMSDRQRKKGLTILEAQLEQTYSQIFSKLIKSKTLRGKRKEILTPVTTILFLPNLEEEFESEETLVAKDISSIKRCLLEIRLDEQLNDLVFREMVSILEGAKGIVRPKERIIEDEDEQWKGALIQKIELEVATFDTDQKRAALNIINGPQRIRGLAGSGKTIILTWKAALIHLENPNAEIIYTFYTKSLYQLIKQLITRFYRQHSDTDPNWNKIKILHAWGGRSMAGVYYEVCRSNGINPLSLDEAQELGRNPFDEICKKLNKEKLKKEADFLLIDEAQDFPSSFYRLAFDITYDGAIVWGYDECQNILNIELQDTKKTFGQDSKGNYLVDLTAAPEGTRNDIILHKCYRNPRNILNLAFSLGFGLYSDRILQMLENNAHWSDLGFEVQEGDSQVGSKMVVHRPRDNSPTIIDDEFPNHENIKFKICENPLEECKFVCKQIIEDIKNGLRPDDILVISIDDMFTRKYFGAIEKILATHDVQTFNLQTAPYNTKVFKHDGFVTLSTVYKAKGNESASVYVMGIDNAYRTRNSINTRNKIFTALTRSKCWLSITGSSTVAGIFKEEIDKTLQSFPNFVFTMPDRQQLKNFQRDLSEGQADMHRLEKEMEEIAKKRGISIQELLKEFEKKK
jgi:superfamily I DNA and RNA helicase